jgi:hypothetical protein
MFLKITVVIVFLLLFRLFIIKIIMPWFNDDLKEDLKEETPSDFLEKMEKDAKRVAKEKADILKKADQKQEKIDIVKNHLNK